jgi:hypothetical protein
VGSAIEFTAVGTPNVLSRAIEEYARAHGHVNALVVPWESDPSRLSMSVTSVKSDGWAIEHTNLGTITLTPAGAETTRVSIAPPEVDAAQEPKLAQVFEHFARQLEARLTAAP